MADTQNYGRSRTSQRSKASQIAEIGTTLPTTSSQLPSSNETGGSLESELSLNLPAWPATPAPSTDIGQTWQSSLPPSELYQLPLDEHLPVEILNINRWSLIQRSSRQDGAIIPEHPAEDFARLKTATDYDAINHTEDGSHELRTTNNEKESDNVCKSPSISKERRREKIHSLRSSFKTSIHDFASELKDGLELRRRAKAVLEAKERERTRTVECTSCFDNIIAAESTLLGCSHAYCRFCFSTLVKTAMLNEQNWPPKCCLTQVPLKVVLLALDTKERIEYKSKAAEYSVPPCDRLYCPGTACRRFIPPGRNPSAGLALTCPNCSLYICRLCRGEAHAENQDCPEDFGLNAALESANEEGWQRCFRCRTMVELSTGCRHITCKCRAEFCYVCGLKWRTCACTETDLVNRRAEVTRRAQRVQRNAVRDAAALREEQEIAQAIAEVAEFERRQVVVRAAARRKEEQERHEEEELLARLEAMSAEEERQRLEANALADKQRQAILHLSMIEHIHSMQKHLESLVSFQQRALISRHESDVAALEESAEEDLVRDLAKSSIQTRTMFTTLTASAEKRRKTLIDRHSREIKTLRIGHEGREDAMFLQMQSYIEDKPNRSERQKWVQNSIERQLEEEREEQTVKQSVERMKFETQLQNETDGIGLAHQSAARIIEQRKGSKLLAMNTKIQAERQYFDFILSRRKLLMKVHATQLLAEVEESRDPQGLTREMAMLNLVPFPGRVDGRSEQTTCSANLAYHAMPLVSQPSESADPRRPVQLARVEMSAAPTISQPSPGISDQPHDHDAANSINSTTTPSPTGTTERRRSTVWNVFGWSKEKPN